MAVTETRLIENGLSGVARGKTRADVRRSYSATYQAYASPADGAQVIIEHFRRTGGLPFVGDIYNFANDRDAFSSCSGLTPSRIEKSGGIWEVKLEYTPLEGDDREEGTDEDGKKTEDPLSWHDEIDVSYTQISIPVEKAIFHGGEQGGRKGLPMALVRKIGDEGPVINAAGVPFDPGIEAEIDIKVVRITKYRKDFNGNTANTFNGAVNSDDVTIFKKAYGYRDFWRALRAKIKNITGTFAIANKIPHWKVTTEVHINPLSWRRFILNRGLERLMVPGLPGEEIDAAGNPVEVSAGDIIPGKPRTFRIKDSEGYPITSPCLLDLEGQPLAPGKDPVYCEYSTYKERPFAGIVW